MEKGLRQVSSDDISGQLSLANRIVSAIADVTGDSDFDGMSVAERAEQLLAVAEKKNTLTVVTGEFLRYARKPPSRQAPCSPALSTSRV